MIIFLNAGCLSTSVSSLKLHLRENPSSGVILDVPFVEQEKEFCGPAALSSIFAFWQKPVTQDKIAEDIFKNELGGVLNIDLEKYARDSGFWAKGYNTDFEDLKSHLRNGIPVIVLEKLHPFILNRNHYTVIIGFSDKHGAIIEHTGSRQSVIRSYNGFKRNWYAGGGWMLKIVPFDKVGDMQSKEDNIELGTVLEGHGLLKQALKRYNTALRLDPESYIALFDIGNIHMRLEEWKQAESAYKQSIALNKTFADVYNNLACVYLNTKEFEKAHKYVDMALDLYSNRKFYYLDTKARIFFAQKNMDKSLGVLKEAISYKETIAPQIVKSFYQFWVEKCPQIDVLLGDNFSN